MGVRRRSVLAVCAAIVFVLYAPLRDSASAVFNDMIWRKAESVSGRQRAFWAGQSVSAFLQSFGLGVGPGSFRSSSLLTAVLGATGVIGAWRSLLIC